MYWKMDVEVYSNFEKNFTTKIYSLKIVKWNQTIVEKQISTSYCKIIILKFKFRKVFDIFLKRVKFSKKFLFQSDFLISEIFYIFTISRFIICKKKELK